MTGKPKPPQFDPAVYTKINLNDLVVYAVHALHKPGTEVAAEDIVRACFVLFPERFALRKYPHWPDSAVVSRRWSDCKSKGYLKGDTVKGFLLTARGIKRAEKLEKSLGKAKRILAPAPKPRVERAVPPAQTIHPELKARAKKYIRSIETSDAFKHFKKGLPINEFDFRSLLLTTMESPPATLARNIAQFKEYVTIHERSDLYSFLEFTEGKFSHLLGKPESQAGGRKAGKGS